jgi:outer membrane lipoprotein-sorting protein
MSSRLLRWLPAVIAPAVVAGAVAVPLAATASADLPPKPADQVLALVAKAKTIPGFTGEVQQTSDLGLPSLPTSGAGSDSSTAQTLNLLTGTHTARVAALGTSRSRVAILDTTAERDVVRNGSTVWLWDSRKNSATELTASGAGAQEQESATMSPADAADALLAKVGPSTDVSVDTTTSVAGHAAYTLVLTPKAADTTVGSIRVAVDATTGLPLRVQAFAKGASSPAFETAFTTLDYTAPDAATFDFVPPSGATVERHAVDPKAHEQHRSLPAADRPTVTGSGWDAVVTIPAADVPAALASNATFQRLTTPTADGRVLATSLVNVLRTDDGRVLAGAVPVSRLVAVAAAQ